MCCADVIIFLLISASKYSIEIKIRYNNNTKIIHIKLILLLSNPIWTLILLIH